MQFKLIQKVKLECSDCLKIKMRKEWSNDRSLRDARIAVFKVESISKNKLFIAC